MVHRRASREYTRSKCKVKVLQRGVRRYIVKRHTRRAQLLLLAGDESRYIWTTRTCVQRVRARASELVITLTRNADPVTGRSMLAGCT